jgi:hypothetical protein
VNSPKVESRGSHGAGIDVRSTFPHEWGENDRADRHFSGGPSPAAATGRPGACRGLGNGLGVAHRAIPASAASVGRRESASLVTSFFDRLARHRLLAVLMETSRYKERSSAFLLRVTSRPALRRPVMAARTVCGSQPSLCPISATAAPSGRSSMSISFARFVLAGGCSAQLTLAVPSSACSAIGSGDEGACSSLWTPSLQLRLAVGSAALVAPARSVPAATECDRTRRLPRFGSCSLLGTGVFVAPVSTFASAFVFARLLVCLAMASLSKSAPRLSRCLHHLKPGARRPGGAATSRRRSHGQQCSFWWRSRVE